jgi:hypothetical protein
MALADPVSNRLGRAEAELAMAERHVREGRAHVRSQERIVTRLEALGGDLRMALELLAAFKATLAAHVAHRDRLRAQRARFHGVGGTLVAKPRSPLQRADA